VGNIGFSSRFNPIDPSGLSGIWEIIRDFAQLSLIVANNHGLTNPHNSGDRMCHPAEQAAEKQSAQKACGFKRWKMNHGDKIKILMLIISIRPMDEQYKYYQPY
jgi:hypothetical protein